MIFGRTAIMLGLALAVPCGVHAQDQDAWVFSGRVTDAETGVALPSAQVFIEGTAFGALADRFGEFELLVRAPRPLVAKIQLIGWCGWTREIRPVDVATDLVVSLFRKPMPLDGPPTVSAHGRAIEKPISRGDLRCGMEASEAARGRGTLDLSERSATLADIEGIVDAVVRHPGFVSKANEHRGDSYLPIIVDDRGLQSRGRAERPFPCEFVSAETGLGALADGRVPAVASLTLEGATADVVTVGVRYELHWDLPDGLRLRVRRAGEAWTAELDP